MSNQTPVLAAPAAASAIPHAELSPNLDFLRAVAVLSVLAAHLAETIGYRHINALGRFGVVLFFVHTSLVLMASLDRMQTVGARGRLTAAFWLRRLFRIYPLAIFFVLLVVVAHIPSDPAVPFVRPDWQTFISNLSLTQNLIFRRPNLLAPLWSLPLEVQMYVLLPFVFFALRRCRALVMWVLVLPLAMFSPGYMRLSVFIYAPCFLAGVVAFDLLRRKVPRRIPPWVWPLAVVSAVCLFGPFDDSFLTDKLYRSWFLCLGLGILYPFTREWHARWLNKAAHVIAEHSYGIYLSHIVLLWIAFVKLPRPWAVPFLCVSLPLTVVVLYRYLERPMTLLGAHLSRRILRASAKNVHTLPGAKFPLTSERTDVTPSR